MQRRCIRQDFRTSRVLPFGIPTRTHWRSMHSQPHSRSSKESAAESVRRSLAKGAGAQTDDPTEAHLRDFRDRATQARLFPTALFWAQKVWAMSRVFCWLETVIECDHVSPQRAERLEDVYELAHIYFLTRDFSRAERLLKDYVRSCSKCLLLSAQCAIEMFKWSEAIDILELPVVTSVQKSAASRGILIQSSIVFLKGIANSHLNKPALAKRYFIEALKIDLRCIEALDWLMDHHALTKEEELDLLSSLNFTQFGTHPSELCQFLFQSKLRHWSISDQDCQLAKTKFRLSTDSDVQRAEAEMLLKRYDFKGALAITTKILDQDPYSRPCLPVHISSLYELQDKNRLYLLAHKLVDALPADALSWYAVGTFYLLQGKNHEARRYFSKASEMDPLLGCAWIGFGHSFALESEHDQAIAAYSAASRKLKGSHLPLLFIGMQHLQAGSTGLAREFFVMAYDQCDTDPLLLQELGVLDYQLGSYDTSIMSLEKAEGILIKSNSCSHILETVYLNLGHTYRKKGNLGLARDNFGKTLCLNATNTGALVALGLLSYLEGDNEQAIEFYHQGLSIEPGNTVTLDLLDKALGQLVNLNPIETILRGIPEPLISKTHPLEKYFSDDVMPGMTVSLVKSTAHLKGPPKWATPHETPGTASHSRRASGVLTRSQAKNLPSDPFTDSVPAPDKKSNMIDFFDGAAKSRLFTSSTMMQNDPVQTPPWNPRNETQAPTRSFLKVGSAVSTASSFSFTPMGNGGTSSGSLFFGSLSRAAEPPLGASESDAIEANATFEAHADTTFEDEDVDMELDDL